MSEPMSKPESALKPFTVEATLYVEDDDADGALATAQSILSGAGGRDDLPDAGDDYSTFGFALGPVRPVKTAEAATAPTAASVVEDRLFEAMHDAGREYLRTLSETEIRAFMRHNEGKHDWLQEVAEDALESLGWVAS